MKSLWDDGLLWKILLFGALIALLGVTPTPKSVSAGLAGAARAQREANPQKLATHLASVAQQQPWRSGLWQAAAQAALAAGEPRPAADYFAQAAARGELSPEGLLAWGDAAWQVADPQTARQVWAIAQRRGLSPAQILPREAQIYRAAGDSLALIANLKAQIALLQAGTWAAEGAPLPNTGDLHLELGLLLAAHDPAAAPAYLLTAAECNPALEPQLRRLNFNIQREIAKNDPAYLLLISGRTLANLEAWDLAELAFENAVAQNPAYAEAWAYLGEARQHTQTGADPLAALQTAVKLDPQSLSGLTFSALYWQRQGNVEAAHAFLQAALELDPRNPALLVEMGSLTALRGDLEAGEGYYWQAMALSPNDPRYVREFLRFRLRYRLNLREVALPLARQLVVSDPTDADSLTMMGAVLFQLGDLHTAERYFWRALAQNPQSVPAHLHLGNLYRLQGKGELAQVQDRLAQELSQNPLTEARRK